MINVLLAHEKSKIEHRSSNISHPGENVAHAQPSVSHEEEEIQDSYFEYESSKYPGEDPEEDDRKPAAKRIKKEPEVEAQSWVPEEQIEKPTPMPSEDKKDYEAIFRKYISTGGDGERHYDVIDLEIEAQRAMRRITDHQEIVKQYQKVVRAYNNFMQNYPWKRIEELIEEKLNQEFPEEAETRENQDFESDEEMTSEMEETDDDSEPNNESINNYWDSANMAKNCSQQ